MNYKFRMHDPRVGRFFAVDPLAYKYPWNSPYAFSENRVLDGIELEGLEVNMLWDLVEVYIDIQTSSFFDKSKVGKFVDTIENGDENIRDYPDFIINKESKAFLNDVSVFRQGVDLTIKPVLQVEAVVVGGTFATVAVVYAAPTIAIIIPEGTGAYLETSLGHAGYDAFKQILANGGDASKVDYLNSLIEGATHGKGGMVKDALKSFLDLTVKDGFNIKSLDEGVYDMTLNEIVGQIFDNLNVSADVSDGEFTKDLFIKVAKSETKEKLKETIDLISQVVTKEPDTGLRKKSKDERSESERKIDNTSVKEIKIKE